MFNIYVYYTVHVYTMVLTYKNIVDNHDVTITGQTKDKEQQFTLMCFILIHTLTYQKRIWYSRSITHKNRDIQQICLQAGILYSCLGSTPNHKKTQTNNHTKLDLSNQLRPHTLVESSEKFNGSLPNSILFNGSFQHCMYQWLITDSKSEPCYCEKVERDLQSDDFNWQLDQFSFLQRQLLWHIFGEADMPTMWLMLLTIHHNN